MKHLGIFNTNAEAESAISQSAITEPYVVMVSGDVYYNTVGESGMTGCWVEDSQGNIYSGVLTENYYDFQYDIPSGATWTLYENGHVVTATSYYMELHEDCEGSYDVVDVAEEDDYTVEDINMGTESPTDESYVHLAFFYIPADSVVNGAITVYYCAPDPCEGYEEGTEDKCNCEGRYWWGDECHDEPEPDLCVQDSDGNIYYATETNPGEYEMEFDVDASSTWTTYWQGEPMTATTCSFFIYNECNGNRNSVDQLTFPHTFENEAYTWNFDDPTIHVIFNYAESSNHVTGSETASYCEGGPDSSASS